MCVCARVLFCTRPTCIYILTTVYVYRTKHPSGRFVFKNGTFRPGTAFLFLLFLWSPLPFNNNIYVYIYTFYTRYIRTANDDDDTHVCQRESNGRERGKFHSKFIFKTIKGRRRCPRSVLVFQLGFVYRRPPRALFPSTRPFIFISLLSPVRCTAHGSFCPSLLRGGFF